MKITSIKPQVKQAGRYSIFIDGQYSFSLSDVSLLESGLVKDQELSREELLKLQQTAEIDKLYSRALHYTALRPRSEWEVRSYLQRKHSPAPHLKTILNKLTNFGLINDLAFARSWVESRRLLKPTSRRRLTQELRAKHIAQEIIQEALVEDETDERTVLHELIIRKRRQSKYRDDLKLMQYLARQGFNYEDIKTALHDNLN